MDLAEEDYADTSDHEDYENEADENEAVVNTLSNQNVISAPNRPLEVAHDIYQDRLATGEPLVWWRGDFYQYVGTHYQKTDESVIRNWIWEATENAVYAKQKNDEIVYCDWIPTDFKVTGVLKALSNAVVFRSPDLEPDNLLATTSGVLQIGLAGEEDVELAHSPESFNLTCLPYAYDPEATSPTLMDWLDSSLPGDWEAQTLLQEWAGYVVSGRTDRQKMLTMVGPTRSGKSTFNRVLHALVGPTNAAGLNLKLLGGGFGAENLIGKVMATASDIRWNSKDIGDSVPILLQITGEDPIEIPRKYKSNWNGVLPTRIVMISNDTPTFSDKSGALSGRMLIAKFAVSFLGKENVTLAERLGSEMPGILNWAIGGLKRLEAIGEFTEPLSGQELREEIEAIANPLVAFVDDWCDLGADKDCDGLDLYAYYRHYMEDRGALPRTYDWFVRDLVGHMGNELTKKRPQKDGVRQTHLYGIGIPGTTHQEARNHISFIPRP